MILLDLHDEKIHQTIFYYLTYTERIRLIQTHTTLLERWFTRIREILLHSEKKRFQFLKNDDFRHNLLQKVSNPMKQISFFDTIPNIPTINGKNDKRSHNIHFPCENPPYYNFISNRFHFQCFHEFMASAKLFEYLSLLAGENDEGEEKKGIESIEYLTLDNCCDHHCKKAFPFLVKATKELCLVGWDVDVLPSLSSTLQNLSLISWKRKGFRLNVIAPNLTKLTLDGSYISNLADFSYLEEVRLISIPELSDTDLPCLNPVKKLELNRCNKITNISCLQDNEEISVIYCENILDYSRSFRNSTRIAIQCFAYNPAMTQSNLAYYSKVKSLSLKVYPSIEFENSAVVNGVPSSLKCIKLHLHKGFHQVHWFSSVHLIELVDCSSVTSLLGLENVPKVILQDLHGLESLNGLGPLGNKFVRVKNCRKIDDFSPLNSIQAVEVISCERFGNGYHVNYVSDLTLHDCKFLYNVKMLYRVHHLTLSNCFGIYSIRGLEDVPRLEIRNCPYIRPSTVSIISRDLGVRVTSDRLTSLPDTLYPVIFEFLSYYEKKLLIRCNVFLFQLLYKRYREIFLYNEEIIDFYTSVTYQKRVLALIENPYDQLQMQLEGNVPVENFQRSLLRISELQSLTISPELFYLLIDRNVESFPKIRSLKLFAVDEFNLPDESPNYLCRATDCLYLRNIHFPSVVTLSSTLTELVIQDCSPEIVLTPLPNLRYLTLEETAIGNNLDEFRSLIEINFKWIDSLDVAPLRNIKRVKLEKCRGIRNMEVLQTNTKVSFWECEGTYDFSNAFRESKMITLLISSDHIPLIDISNYRKVERLILGSNRTLPFCTPLSTGPIPLTLKEFTVIRVTNLDGLGRGFGHVHSVRIIHCPKFSSIIGLETVHTIYFDELKELRSLRGLGVGNQYVTVKRCPNIRSFSPLKKVPRVEINDCDSFTTASDVDEVNYLQIIRCKNLKDVKALRNIDHLELIGCSAALSTAELINVRKLVIQKKYEDELIDDT